MMQGTEEWFTSRLGKVTASRLADVMAKIKTGEAASRANYRAELVAERLTGKSSDGFTSPAMKWGTECEPLARAAYEAESGLLVVETGLVDHPSIAMAGASPDGLIGADGVLEIKCPETKAHIDTLLTGEAPAKYIPQMMWQMACTGRAWADFVSFDPRMPPDLQLCVIHVPRDDKLIQQYEAEVAAFLGEVAETVQKLQSIRK